MHQSGTKNVGEMLSIYSIARELGGWEHEACRRGAFRYACMCLRVNKALLCNETHWSGLKFFRYIKNLSWSMNIQTWEHEVESFTTTEENEWRVKADLNKAAIAYAAGNGCEVTRCSGFPKHNMNNI